MKNPDHANEFVIPISYGSTEVIETGKWGFQKPQTVFMTAPCQETCPAGNPIPQFLYFATQGKYDEALRTLLRENPFPGVCGRSAFIRARLIAIEVSTTNQFPSKPWSDMYLMPPQITFLISCP